MNGWSSLPNEILKNIFGHLKKTDLGQCSLICRSWVSPSQCYLLEYLTPKTDNALNNIKDIISIYQNDSSFISYNQSPANSVRSLDCRCVSNWFDMSLADEVFPFLEFIHLHERQQLLHNKIYALIMKGKLKNLKKIPFLEWNQAHLELVLSRKIKIQYLTIFREYMYEALEKLHNFSNLETLDLQCVDDNTTKICLQSLLLNTPPKLKSIYLTFTSPSTLILNNATLDMNNISALTSVKCLKINNSHLLLRGGDTRLIYIMKKFPCLERLEITCATQDLFKTNIYTVPNVHTLIRFLIFLFEMNHLSQIHPILTNEVTPDVVSNFLAYVLEQKNTHVKMKITFSAIDSPQPFENFNNGSKFITVNNFHCNTKKLCTLNITYKIMREHITSAPCPGLLEQLSNVGVEVVTIGNTRRDGPLHKVLIDLNIVFDSLKNLKSLCLYKIKEVLCWEEEAYIEKLSKSTTLTSLYMRNCNFHVSIFSNISSNCPNLKRLEINACVFKQERDDKTYFPDPNYGIVSIRLPYSRLDDLRSIVSSRACYYEDSLYFPYGHSKALIRLRTGDHKKTRYCEITFQHGVYGDSIDVCSRARYKSQLQEKECIVYQIYCESVTTLTVNTDENTWKRYGQDFSLVLVEEER